MIDAGVLAADVGITAKQLALPDTNFAPKAAWIAFVGTWEEQNWFSGPNRTFVITPGFVKITQSVHRSCSVLRIANERISGDKLYFEISFPKGNDPEGGKATWCMDPKGYVTVTPSGNTYRLT